MAVLAGLKRHIVRSLGQVLVDGVPSGVAVQLPGLRNPSTSSWIRFTPISIPQVPSRRSEAHISLGLFQCSCFAPYADAGQGTTNTEEPWRLAGLVESVFSNKDIEVLDPSSNTYFGCASVAPPEMAYLDEERAVGQTLRSRGGSTISDLHQVIASFNFSFVHSV